MSTPPALGFPRITVERVKLPVQTSADPTGNPPSWGAARSGDVPATWVAGTWEGSWAPGVWLEAVSPTIGAIGAEIPLTVGRWVIWFRFPLGSETPARAVGVIDVA
jgi:hypothetical protein